MEKKITISAEVYDSVHELPDNLQKLVAYASDHIPYAYAPYSGFKVAAAVLLANGQMVAGTNQENIALPLGACAEQNVLNRIGSSNPVQKIAAIAIISHSENNTAKLITPCGGCRQIIKQYELRQGAPVSILCASKEGQVFLFPDANTLLPWSFGS